VGVARPSLELCVLAVLAGGDAHGYAISQALAAAGLGEVKGGTLYPLLARLEALGAVVSRWDTSASGPARKAYTLTVEGRRRFVESADAWRASTRQVEALLDAALGPVEVPRRRRAAGA
jgi:PadR family transcriptional regulator, regulatory protein PadR